MTIRSAIVKIVQQDEVNFLLTNRIPRRLATRLIGWFGRIEHPLVCALSLRVWRLFSDLDLSDAEDTRFASLHHCFIRRLKEGARPVDHDPAVLVSPCDGIIGAAGTVEGNQVLQIKGSPYALEDLLGEADHAEVFRGGLYVTLRLTSSMYHHFHAPYDCRVGSVTHIPGDTWNVNAIALRRVARLFCKNERAVIRTTLSCGGHQVTLVAVAAILVAGIRLRFLDLAGRPRRAAPKLFRCAASFRKGDELGWFEHGSTIILLMPAGFSLCDEIGEGVTVRVGQALVRGPTAAAEAVTVSSYTQI